MLVAQCFSVFFPKRPAGTNRPMGAPPSARSVHQATSRAQQRRPSAALVGLAGSLPPTPLAAATNVRWDFSTTTVLGPIAAHVHEDVSRTTRRPRGVRFARRVGTKTPRRATRRACCVLGDGLRRRTKAVSALSAPLDGSLRPPARRRAARALAAPCRALPVSRHAPSAM